ncbi:hypothetical protein B7494_g5622 [Chlorociboria aeruginascens]|nr:hypothetical protein B7494_g5622 [Chlorociboria aeruginascens]
MAHSNDCPITNWLHAWDGISAKVDNACVSVSGWGDNYEDDVASLAETEDISTGSSDGGVHINSEVVEDMNVVTDHLSIVTITESLVEGPSTPTITCPESPDDHASEELHHHHIIAPSTDISPFTLTDSPSPFFMSREFDHLSPYLTSSFDSGCQFSFGGRTSKKPLLNINLTPYNSYNPRPSTPDLSPRAMMNALHHFTLHTGFEEQFQKQEKANPFPDIDLNFGWNRARYTGQHWHLCSLHKDSNRLGVDLDAEQRMDIQAQFNAFSFSAQAYPKTVKRDIAGMFHRVFVGAELDGGWSRKPGTWWKIKYRMLAEDREKGLLEDLEERARPIAQEVLGLVRKRKIIMSEEWRARRREQEKKAGRWTDGTLRTDEFRITYRTYIEKFADTRTRALTAKVELLPTDISLVSTSDYILSIVPPRDAFATAQRITAAFTSAPQRSTPLYYLDLNAISPHTARTIASHFQTTAPSSVFIDGGIIGGPPSLKTSPEVNNTPATHPTTTHSWNRPSIPLSGPSPLTSAPTSGAHLANVLNSKYLGEEIGKASGLKCCFASTSKGFTALCIQAFTTAHQMGVMEELKSEMEMRMPALYGAGVRSARGMPPKAYRWVAEMEEIARTHREEGAFESEKGVFGEVAAVYKAVANDTILGQEKTERRKRGLTIDDVALFPEPKLGYQSPGHDSSDLSSTLAKNERAKNPRRRGTLGPRLTEILGGEATQYNDCWVEKNPRRRGNLV